MKYILFTLVTFTFQLVLGAQAFTGFITRRAGEYYFSPVNSQLFYSVSTSSKDVIDNLARLENGDYVVGYGTLDGTTKKLAIESVDYVGLRKLLGPWVGADGTMVFKDFSTMRFTPRFRDFKMDARFTNYQKEFRYSVTPGDGNEWALFLSDDKSTTFATVEFTKNKVIMKIFESESGKIVRTLKLERP